MPVYMVLQAFSWHELGDRYSERGEAYPTFADSRFMAYDVIARGASGILYWGSHYLQSEACREAIYAVISELAALQPFLTAPEAPGTRLHVIEGLPEREPRVVYFARAIGDEWLVVLVNEDDERRMGVVVEGLDALNGRTLCRLYTDHSAVVARGELITRMQPRAVHVYATSRDWETPRRDGRDYGMESPPEQEDQEE